MMDAEGSSGVSKEVALARAVSRRDTASQRRNSLDVSVYAFNLRISPAEWEEFPEELFGIPELTRLLVINVGLVRVPLGLDRFSQLTELYLGHNRLPALPPEIGRLQQLHTIYAGVNEIASIPREITELTRLNVLYLVSNPLPAVPFPMSRARSDGGMPLTLFTPPLPCQCADTDAPELVRNPEVPLLLDLCLTFVYHTFRRRPHRLRPDGQQQ